MTTSSSVPGQCDFVAKAGTGFLRLLRSTVKSTGAAIPLAATVKARGQIRTYDGRTGTTTTSTLKLDLNEDDGNLFVSDHDTGETTLNLSEAETRSLNPDNEQTVKLYYEIELFDDTQSPEWVRSYMAGAFIVLFEGAR